jgi:hypothetical protein
MSKQLCTQCAMYEDEHAEVQAANAATIVMMQVVAKSLPKDYAETLEQILIDWRTHTLPECDPMAID